MAKETKKYRKNFRFTEQVAGMLEDAASRLGIKENPLVSDILFDFLSNNKNFVNCPKCHGMVAYKAIIPVLEGVIKFECRCGTALWWDSDNDKIIKHK